jgi:AraC-like DNA-binding protein
MEELSPDTALAAPAFAYVEFGAAHGLARDHLMQAAGLTEAMRADPDARIPIFAFVILWRELLTGLPEVVVPVELVRALDASVLGVTGQAALRADDLGHAAEVGDRFLRLSDTALRAARLERGERVGLALGHRPEVEAMRFPIEVMLGLSFRLLHHATHGALPLAEVTFKHAAGYPVAAYEALFGAPVRFEAEASALWVPRAALAMPLPDRDPLVRRYLEAHAAQLLAALPAPAPAIVGQLREAILVELATSGAELGRVARRVAASPRTIQRRLEEAGTSYQQLVEDVRSALARQLLRDRARSIIDVAFELGYADLKGFYRAFKRWTGETPGEWRARP